MGDSYKFGYWANSSEELLKTQFPLHHACREGDAERLSLLLVQAQHGIYEEDSFYGWTPAHWAAYFGKLNCLMCLMEKGVNCDVATLRFNQTPSHIAAFSAHSHCLKWLLHCGATMDRQDYLGETPVHKAARTGSMECASLLAAHGANVRIANNNHHSPAQLARMCGHEQCALYLDSIVHDLERSANILVPPIPHHTSAPNVEPCLITQGLNGGQIPTDFTMEHHNDTEMEMGMDGAAGDGIHGKAHDHFNGNVHFSSNGVMNGHSAIVNGAGNGSCDGDITVIPAISQNRVPIAGKKRAREEFEDSDFKRARHGDSNEEFHNSRCLSEGPALSHDYSVMMMEEYAVMDSDLCCLDDKPAYKDILSVSIEPMKPPPRTITVPHGQHYLFAI